MAEKLEFDFDPEPGSDSWEFKYRTIMPRVADMHSVLEHLDNDGMMLLDTNCLIGEDLTPGHLAVANDTGYPELDGKVVLICGMKTGYEVEGG